MAATRSSKPPPVHRPDVDRDLNEAAERLWVALRRMPWLDRVGVGHPEPRIHLHVTKYSPEQKFYVRNGWSGFTVILHLPVPSIPPPGVEK